MAENPLHKLMNPKSVAVFGASNNIARMGSLCLLAMISEEFDGPIYPVHPSEDTIFGLKAYKSLKDLPEVPELLLLVIPSHLVPEVLEEAGEIGIDRVIIITAGYEEVDKTEGREMQERINQIVEKYGIRYIGPNCIGVYNSYAKLNTTVFQNRLKPGKVGMISHSGTYLSHIFPYLESIEFNFGEGISLGNAASIDTIDALEYFEERDEIKVIAMYLEGVQRADKLVETARRISLKKPIVALYVGGTEGGARSAATHTAAITVSDTIIDAAFRQTGIIRAYSIEELLDYSWAFATQPLPKGDRMAVVSVSGGPGSSLADSISRSCLKLPEFSDKIRREIEKYLPHTGISINPVDITYSMDKEAYTRHIPEIVLGSDEIDGLFIYGNMNFNWILDYKDIIGGETAKIDVNEVEQNAILEAKETVKILSKFNKPVFGTTFQGHSDSMIQTFRREGIPFYPASERAVKAMAAMCAYCRYRDSRL